MRPNLADMPEQRLLVAVLLDAIRWLEMGGQKEPSAVIDAAGPGSSVATQTQEGR
jgi:hypothetical protein